MLIELLEKSSNPIGIFGVILLLIAYFLLSTNRMSSQSLSYQLYNLFGAVFILFSLCFHFNLSSFVIEVCWVAISLIGIYRIKVEVNKKKHQDATDNLYQISAAKKKKPAFNKL